MENNQNKTQNQRKVLITIIILLVIFLVIAIPFSIISLNKTQKNDDKLKPAKQVKNYDCVTKGKVCSFEEMYKGVEVNIEVAQGKTYTFNMIDNDKETMTLMLQQNIENDIEWHSEGINLKGPQTSLQLLNEKVKDWTNVNGITKYSYIDGGKTDLERLCNSTHIEPGFKCPTDEKDTRGYNGLTIENGSLKLLFNLPPSEDLEPGFEVIKEGTINVNAKARFLTLEEYEKFNTNNGVPKWLVEGLDNNIGYWTLTSSPSMTTAYFQGAIAIVNKNKKPSVEAVFVTNGATDDYKIGIRPVIQISKK